MILVLENYHPGVRLVGENLSSWCAKPYHPGVQKSIIPACENLSSRCAETYHPGVREPIILMCENHIILVCNNLIILVCESLSSRCAKTYHPVPVVEKLHPVAETHLLMLKEYHPGSETAET